MSKITITRSTTTQALSMHTKAELVEFLKDNGVSASTATPKNELIGAAWSVMKDIQEVFIKEDKAKAAVEALAVEAAQADSRWQGALDAILSRSQKMVRTQYRDQLAKVIADGQSLALYLRQNGGAVIREEQQNATIERLRKVIEHFRTMSKADVFTMIKDNEHNALQSLIRISAGTHDCYGVLREQAERDEYKTWYDCMAQVREILEIMESNPEVDGEDVTYLLRWV